MKEYLNNLRTAHKNVVPSAQADLFLVINLVSLSIILEIDCSSLLNLVSFSIILEIVCTTLFNLISLGAVLKVSGASVGLLRFLSLLVWLTSLDLIALSIVFEIICASGLD